MDYVVTSPQLGRGLGTNRPEPGQSTVENWIKFPGEGKEWWNQNGSFRLAFGDRSLPDPRFKRLELDLTLPPYPDVEDPFAFDAPLIYLSQNQGSSPGAQLEPIDVVDISAQLTASGESNPSLLGADGDIVRPTCYDENLQPIYSSEVTAPNHCRKFLDPNRGSFGVRIYPSRAVLRLQALRWGENHDLAQGQPLHIGLREELGSEEKPKVHGGRYGNGSASLPDPSEALLDATVYDPDTETYGHYPERFTRAYRDCDQWPIAGIDYRFNDGLDAIRAEVEIRHQRFYPDFLLWGNSALDAGVEGLNDGGNRGETWIDPMYHNLVSQINYYRILKTSVPCYRQGVCEALTYSDELEGSPPISDVNPGFRRNVYADVDGQPYCRYKLKCPAKAWRNRVFDDDQMADWFRYQDVPRRANEYDGHYRLLMQEILTPFRQGGYYEVLENCWAAAPEYGTHYSFTEVTGGWAVVAEIDITTDTCEFGQLMYESSVGHDTVPAGTVLFWFAEQHPIQLGLSYGDPGYDTQLLAHINGDVFAKIWIINTNSEKECLVVKLHDDYVSPKYRIYSAESNSLGGGSNPCVRDLATKGANNGGMRDYLQEFEVTDDGLVFWTWIQDGYELNPHGFYNVEGGSTWYAGSMMSGPKYMDVQDPRASGTYHYYGLPGEELRLHDLMAHTPHPLLKWGHLAEIYEKLYDPMYVWEYPNLSGAYGMIHSSVDGVMVNPFTKLSLGPSDVALKSDFQHARNLVLPICSFLLTGKQPLNEGYAGLHEFDEYRQDWCLRYSEPNAAMAARHGFKTAPIQVWMESTKNGIQTPERFFYWSKSRLPHQRRLKQYHPQGQKWWHDNALLGCGYEEGDAPAQRPRYTGEVFRAEGQGFAQKGRALVSYWRRNVPSHLEIAAAYLQLVPSQSNYIDHRLYRLPGTDLAYPIPGNIPFVGQEVLDTGHDEEIQDFVIMEAPEVIGKEVQAAGGITGYYMYEWESYADMEYPHGMKGVYGRFVAAYLASQRVCGDYNFFYKGALGRATMPTGGYGYSQLFFKKYDETETKNGHLLDNIGVTVRSSSGGQQEFSTKLRSRDWYQRWAPYFKEGRHTQDHYGGLNTRLDNDEDDDRGYGFACQDGGWAVNHRIFDITNLAKASYVLDRFDAIFISEPYGIEWVTGDLADLTSLEAQTVTHGSEDHGLTIDYEAQGSRVISALTYPSSAGADDILGSEPGEGSEWGAAEGPCYLVVNLEQTATVATEDITTDQMEEWGRTHDVPYTLDELRVNSYPAICRLTVAWDTENAPTHIWIFFNPWRDSSTLGSSKEWVLLKVVSTADYPDGEYILSLAGVDNSVQMPVIARSIKLVMPDGGRLHKVHAEGVPMIEGLVAITAPPRSETFNLASGICFKDYQEWIQIMPLQMPPSKVYQVRFDPYYDGNPDLETLVKNGYLSSFVLNFDGLYDPTSPPKLYFNQYGVPFSGTWQFDAMRNGVVVSSFRRYDDDELIGGNPEEYDEAPDIPVSVVPNLGPISGSMLSALYVEGAGAGCKLLATAEHTGPCYDIDPDSIIEIDNLEDFPPSGASAASGETGQPWSPWFYHGDAQDLLPWVTFNPKATFNGYRPGKIPDRLNDSMSPKDFFWSGNPIDNMFSEHAAVWQLVYGEPCMVLPSRIVFKAPAFIRPRDPVTAEPLDSGFATGGFSSETWPNGGRVPGSLEIRLETSDPGITPLEEIEDGDDAMTPFKRKQAAFEPRLHLYLRERTTRYLGNTEAGLTF